MVKFGSFLSGSKFVSTLYRNICIILAARVIQFVFDKPFVYKLSYMV